MQDTEIDRLNLQEQYKLFQYNSNLLDCIKMKLFSLFYNEFLCSIFENEAYNINEKRNYEKRIKELENENNKLKGHIDIDMPI